MLLEDRALCALTIDGVGPTGVVVRSPMWPGLVERAEHALQMEHAADQAEVTSN